MLRYRDTYFLWRAVATDESLHFHELVHVVQCLLLYAAGLAESGYRDCALEAMAYDHQRRFDAGDPPYAVDLRIREVSQQYWHGGLPPLSTPNVFSWWRGLRGERISLSVLHADVVFDQLSRMCDFEQTTRRYPATVNVQTKVPKMEIPDKENVYGKRRTP